MILLKTGVYLLAGLFIYYFSKEIKEDYDDMLNENGFYNRRMRDSSLAGKKHTIKEFIVEVLGVPWTILIISWSLILLGIASIL